MDETSTSLHQNKYSRNALKRKIEFYKHSISESDKQELLKTLESIFLTTGPKVKKFEEKFACYVGSKFAVALTSCTHALEMALRYFKIGSGDEVITTPMSFVATSNSIEYVGAMPVFVDVEHNTGNIDVNLIEKSISSRTKAILVVHLYGQMCDMVRIKKIAARYNLKIIEDCAHCIEGIRENIRPGQLGDVACYSFYATKNLSCGEGGAITCNDPKIYEWMLSARQHGICKNAAERYTKKYEYYDMHFLGMKCNMSDLQASLLIHQIDRLDNYISLREEIAQLYDQAFINEKGISLPSLVGNCMHARHLYTIWVDEEQRDQYLQGLYDCGVGVAVNYLPIHKMYYYRKKYGYQNGAFPIAEKIGKSTISLPLYPSLKTDDVDYVIDCVKSFGRD